MSPNKRLRNDHWYPQSDVGPSFDKQFKEVAAALDAFDPGSSLPKDGYQVIDFFSGCGGMSLGFHSYGMVFGGIGSLSGVDLFPKAASTYCQNLGRSAVADIRHIASSSDISSTLTQLVGFDPGRPTILIGCPPCQGFSAHTRTRGIRDDGRNSLVLDLARIAVAIKPEAIVVENVPQILAGKHRAYWDSFEHELASEGYHFTCDIHNLATFGVPQQRNRALCLGLRSKIGPLPDVLAPSQYKTVHAAIGDLVPIQAGERIPSDPLHRTVRHRPSTMDVISQVPKNGGSRPRGVGPACLDRVRGFFDVYGRLAWERPSITVTRYSRSPASGRFTHPEQNRGLSAREVARIQTFPDRFGFVGSLDDTYRQIGEAVPPRAAVAVACWVMLHLTGRAAGTPSVIASHSL